MSPWASAGKLKTVSSGDRPLAENMLVPSIRSGRNVVKNHLAMKVNEVSANALVDTGASVSLLSREFAKKVRAECSGPCPTVLRSASGEVINNVGIAAVKVSIGKWTTTHSFVIGDVSQSVILGVDFLELHGARLDFKRGLLSIGEESLGLCEKGIVTRESCDAICSDNFVVPPRHEVLITAKVGSSNLEGLDVCFEPKGAELEVCLAHVIAQVRDGLIPLRLMNVGPEEVTLYEGTILGSVEVLEPPSPVAIASDDPSKAPWIDIEKYFDLEALNLSRPEREALHKLLTEFEDIFSRGAHDIGRTNLAKHKIDTGDSRPIKQAMRRVPFQRYKEVENLVKDMIKQDVIEPSSSPWASPIVLVKKKDGSTRFCIDYRKLNSVTKKDAYPLPRIDEILDHLSGAKYFSSLDLASGYWQVEVEPEDREKTAFITGEGLFQFKVLPFGLSNAPGTFQRLMDAVLSGLKWKIALVYLDDIVVWSATIEEHLSRLREVFSRIRQAGLKLKPQKCQLLQERIAFLGHEVSADGIRTDPAKVKAVKEWPVPRDAKSLRSFLGFATYYKRFINGFAELADPLFKETEKGRTFRFTPELEGRFHALKEALVSAPILALPREEGEFFLDCDASDVGLGAVLSQVQEGVERVISYAGRSLTKQERRYCTTRKEMLALVYGIRQFRCYLYGRSFTVRTDHNSLRWLQSFKEPEGQVARWLEQLAPYDFSVVHRPGRLHANADALSRICHQCGLLTGNQDTVIGSEMGREEEDIGTITGLNSLLSISLTENEIQKSQEEDKVIGEVRRWLTAGSRPDFSQVRGEAPDLISLWTQWKRLKRVKGVLCRSWEDEKKPVRWQIVVPQTLREDILKQLHVHPTGGHLGISRTLGKLRDRYYWPGHSRDVEVFINSCKECHSRKGSKARAPMQLTTSGFPFQRIAIDLLGPLPRTKRSNAYVAVVTDYFTKWVEAYPLPNIEAETVVNVLMNEFVARYGVPYELHSDQGRQFEAKLIQDLTEKLGIKKTRTTPYHPQSDGLVERFNRTLCSMLSLYVNDHHSDWDDHIPLLMMAYRSSKHESTKYSPYFALFGREVTLPIDAMHGRLELESDLNEFVRARLGIINETHQFIREHQKRAQHRQKDYYDKRSSEGSYEEGDQVWLWSPVVRRGRSAKLHRPWEGPYLVIKKLSDVTYRIQSCRNPRKRLVVHFNRLKKYSLPVVDS